MEIRPYESFDAEALWELKRAFETGLGEGTGDGGKAAAYREKLDEHYRTRWLGWVDDCAAERSACVAVAEADADEFDGDADADVLVGYSFLLPESLAFVWDAAVLNELYVRPGARGTGVAGDLLETAVTTAREQDLPLDRLVLDVDPDNGRAKSFYERHGFTSWGEMVARDL